MVDREVNGSIERGHVAHILFLLTATVAFSTPTDGSVGFSPISPEKKVILISY